MARCAICGVDALERERNCSACGAPLHGGAVLVEPGTSWWGATGPERAATATVSSRVLPPRPPLVVHDPPSNLEPLVGLVASAAIVVGALTHWIGRYTSYRIPLAFLFGIDTTSWEPRVLWVLLALGFLGAFASLSRDLAKVRVLVGLLAAGAVGLFFAQLESEMFAGANFTDIVGTGCWLVLLGGVALMLSPLLRHADGARWFAIGVFVLLLAWVGWEMAHPIDVERRINRNFAATQEQPVAAGHAQ
jgi:hypothetical protein